MTKKDATDYLSACADGYDPVFDEAVEVAVAALQSQDDGENCACPGAPAPKSMSNADRIRAMGEIMFAMLGADLTRLDMPVRPYRGRDVNDNYDWLRQPHIEG